MTDRRKDKPLSPDPVQQWIGVKASILVAGLLGGVVSGIAGTGSFLQRMASAFVGCITSVYLTPMAVEMMGGWFSTVGSQLEHAAAFLCGLLGMTIVQGLTVWMKRRAEKPEGLLPGG